MTFEGQKTQQLPNKFCPRTILTFLILMLAPPQLQASGECYNYFSGAHTYISEQVYQKLSATSNWSGSETPLYFRGRNFFNFYWVNLVDSITLKYAQFAYKNFNDPVEFRAFLKDLILEVNKYPQTPLTREQLISTAKIRLAKNGFQFENALVLLTAEEFFSRVERGIIILETDPSLLTNGHGHDTHILQLAYLLKAFDAKYGPGHLLSFYKSMAKFRAVWRDIFDETGTDNLGHPKVLTYVVAPILGTK